MKLRLIHFLLSILFLASLLSCSDADDITAPATQSIPPEEYTFVHFDPTAGNPAEIPLPNEILRNPVTGQLALPLTGDPAVDGLISQVNTLSGFSTTAAIRIPFAGKVVADSVNNDSILVVDLAELQASLQGVPVNPIKAMNFDVRDDESGANSVVFASPVFPLSPQHPHLVVITKAVLGADHSLPVESEQLTILLKGRTSFLDADGNSTRITLSNELAQQLEPLRSAYEVIWEAAEQATEQDRLDIPFSFLFTTQPLYGTLTELRERAQQENPVPVIDLPLIGAEAVNGLFVASGLTLVPRASIGAVYLGHFEAPNYIHPTLGFFTPDLQQISRIPINFMAALPPGPGPYPVVIYQHGLGTTKETMLLLAEGFCANGIGVIGIDLVLHGDRSLIGPGGEPLPSGTGFVNLANILNSRDNLRQSVVDLTVLTRMITSGNTDFDGNGISDCLSTAVNFLGMSLGGITGTTFVTVEPNIPSAVLNVPGGRFLSLLNKSASFGPAIDDGLATFGLFPGTALYDIYFLFAQTIVDDGDPINYAPHTISGSLSGGAGTNVLMEEVLDDQVVPNSGTEDLARAMGLAQVDALTVIPDLEQLDSPVFGSGLYQFADTHHGALLDLLDLAPIVQAQVVFYLGNAFLGEPTIINPVNPKTGEETKTKRLSYLPDAFNPDYSLMDFKNLIIPLR